MRLWLIPMSYAVVSIACGFGFPRIEYAFLASYTLDVSIPSVQAFLSAVASGMMALTGIVFSIAFVVVQFSAIAYSPRLVLLFARDPLLFHSLGMFVATFMYSLSTLLWVDRGGSGAVPLFSALLVAALLVVSVILFSRLVQRVADLQITTVLHTIGGKGRRVIREMFARLEKQSAPGRAAVDHKLGAPTQTLHYGGEPRTITAFDVRTLVGQATEAGAVIVLAAPSGTLSSRTR